MTKPYSSHYFIANCFIAGNIKGEWRTLKDKGEEHQSDTKVFIMKMEILLESTSNKLSKDSILQAGNPVKEILLKLNLPDHRILKDVGEEVLKLKNFKKDALLKLFKLTNQERYEHVGPKVTSTQDGKVYKIPKRDYAWLMISRYSRSYGYIQVRETSSSLKSMITTPYSQDNVKKRKSASTRTKTFIESLKVQDRNKPKGNNVFGLSVFNMVDHNNSFKYNDNKGTKGSVDGSSNSLKGQNMFNKSLQVYYVTISEAYFVQDDDVTWTDRGGEYMDTLYFLSVGIIYETTVPYTPQQNVPRPSIKIPNGTQDIGGSAVPEEIIQQHEPDIRKSKKNRTPMNFGHDFNYT
nr:zinc finger, CCHC-type [Tanacetum cinerariifolium]